MGRLSAGSRESSPGTISVTCLGPSELRLKGRAASVPAKLDRYTYQAPSSIAGSLANFDRYTAEVYTPLDGRRRFVPRPEEGLEGYIARGFQIGHSWLTHRRGWSKETFDDYLFGKLAYDWACHARERMAPRNLTAVDLVTPRHLLAILGRRDALPDELTAGADDGRGSDLVNRVACAGVAAAAARGMERAGETETLALGLMAFAAEKPPLGATPAQIAMLVREALFDFGDDADVTTKMWEEAAEQFERSVRDRLHVSQEKFNAWLYGKRAYMLQTLEKDADRTLFPATGDRRALMRRAMLDQAWKGFGQVSECLDAFAQIFERAILRPLSEPERRQFGIMYRRRPYFGDFVLPLLLDAKDLLEHAVRDLWDTPDDSQAIEILPRLLLYRSQIIPRLRETQRIARAFKNSAAQEAIEEDKACPEESLWEKLTGQILESRGIRCPECPTPLICRRTENSTTRSPTISVGCEAHDYVLQLTIAPSEWRAAYEAVYGEMP